MKYSNKSRIKAEKCHKVLAPFRQERPQHQQSPQHILIYHKHCAETQKKLCQEGIEGILINLGDKIASLKEIRMPLITFHQVKSDGTYEMHAQINAPPELQPSLFVALDPGSVASNLRIK